MKVLHLSSSDLIGGAAKACLNISNALRSIGIDSKILVQQKIGNSESVKSINTSFLDQYKTKARIGLDYLLIGSLTHKERGRFTIPFIGSDISEHPEVKSTDILHLHWINGGYISLKILSKLTELNKSIVWTLHDMWPFTGGCHYTGECRKFEFECGECPALKFKGKKDLSNKIFKQKDKIYMDKNINVVTCSKWLAEEAGSSRLFKDKNISVIPNPIDTEIFKPHPQNESRNKLGIPLDKIVIMFSSFTVYEKRKGFELLKDSLNEIFNNQTELRDKINVIVLGSAGNEIISEIPFKVILPGRISDDKMISHYYSAADFFVAPSLQENLSNTVMESLSCGTPVVAFKIGGMPDMIEHKVNGYLVDRISTIGLANGIKWLFMSKENIQNEFRKKAREKVITEFTFSHIGEQYGSIYNRLLM